MSSDSDGEESQAHPGQPDGLRREERDVVEVTTHVVASDTEHHYGEEVIQAAYDTFDDDQYIITEVLFDEDPDLMRGLDRATVTFRDGSGFSGPVPFSFTGESETDGILLAISDRGRQEHE